MICAGYTCRRCSTKFDEADCLKCEAPNFRFKSVAERRNYDKAEELASQVAKGTQEERLKAIGDLLKLVPAKPKDKEPENGK
jgi:hypothetical protein